MALRRERSVGTGGQRQGRGVFQEDGKRLGMGDATGRPSRMDPLCTDHAQMTSDGQWHATSADAGRGARDRRLSSADPQRQTECQHSASVARAGPFFSFTRRPPSAPDVNSVIARTHLRQPTHVSRVPPPPILHSATGLCRLDDTPQARLLARHRRSRIFHCDRPRGPW